MSRGYHHIQEYEKEILEIRISVKYKVIYRNKEKYTIRQ